MATVEDMLAQALTHHRAGRLNEADLFYRQILTDWPNNPDALHRFGVLAAQLGHHEPAATLISRAIQQRPASGDFYASLGNVLYLQGRLHDGQEAYKVAMYLAYIKHMPFGFDEILDRAGKPSLHTPQRAATAEVGAYKSQALQDLGLRRRARGGDRSRTACLFMSYGEGTLFEVMLDEVDGVKQAAMVQFPFRFNSGVMRGRVNPRDGQVYLSGLERLANERHARRRILSRSLHRQTRADAHRVSREQGRHCKSPSPRP